MADVAREIDARRGARVRSVHQDDKLAFRLDLRGEARDDLVIVLAPPLPRVHLAAPRPAPKTPSALAGSLRRLVKGAMLTSAHAVPGERALCLVLQRSGAETRLWIELFGGQANLYVVDGAREVLLTPRGDVAKRRGASKGMRFEPVPARDTDAAPAGTPEGASPSSAIEALASSARRARKTGTATTRLRRFVKRKLRAAEKAQAQLERALEREAEADEHHRKGELLHGAFHLLKPGLTSVRVPDYTQDPPVEVEVELDPNVAPGDQVAACFKRERKCRRAAEEARKRLGAGAGDADALRDAQGALEDELDAAALERVVAALPERLHAAARRELEEPAPTPKRKEPARARPWHTYTSADGWPVLVGRDARGNDELTLKRAAPGDLFLHVRGASGSHVIVPTPRGKTVPRDTLLDAAALACHFSERRKAEHNEVDHTPRRYVRKPRGAPAGLVRVERSKTLAVRRDEARIARLLASRARPGASADSSQPGTG